jgi:hypothetical protein
MIKLRGDPCWRDLTCLAYHYETQPLPNPLSWLLHQTPPWFHRVEVLWNHFIELVVPFGLFGPRRVRTAAGLLTIVFQTTLIISGNLSWLNYLTVVICLACLDDGTLTRLLPARLTARFPRLLPPADLPGSPLVPASRPQRLAVGALALAVALLSIRPALNLVSRTQVMNGSFDPLHLVNTYGAFGSIGRVRHEVILAGTDDDPTRPDARWLEYDLPCKPGNLQRRPCVIAPYQLRLDWQVWFAAMSEAEREPWLVHLVYKLLQGDRPVRALLAPSPFADHPPRAIRADLYEYHFTRWGDRARGWWTRRRAGDYLRPLTLADPALRAYVADHGWPVAP